MGERRAISSCAESRTRFLNAIGGYTRSVNTYSLAAAEVILPHVLGGITDFIYFPTPWRTITQHTDLMVAFGGLPVKNGQIGQVELAVTISEP